MNVSVVISTFQRPTDCRTAIESALAQTTPPLEVLVCDDGSSDEGYREIVEWAHCDERLTFMRLPHSGSPAGGRNAGIRAARGEWIGFLDDDDEWLPTKLSTQLEVLTEVAADVVSANALLADGSRYFPEATSPEYVSRHSLLLENPVILSSVIARRDLLLKAGGFPTDTRLAGIEDYCLWMRMSDLGARFLVLPDALVRYEHRGTNRLSENDALQGQLTRQVLKRWRRHPLDRVLLHAMLRHASAALRLSLSRALSRAVERPRR